MKTHMNWQLGMASSDNIVEARLMIASQLSAGAVTGIDGLWHAVLHVSPLSGGGKPYTVILPHTDPTQVKALKAADRAMRGFIRECGLPQRPEGA